MLKFSCLVMLAIFAAAVPAVAQDSSPAKAKDDLPKTEQKQGDLPVVTRMLAYGKKQPGKVWREEVTDERLFRLFDLADTKKEGVVTKEQLMVAAAKLEVEQPQGGRPGPGEGPGRGRVGSGGRGGGFGGRPQLGMIMPRFVQDELKLSDAQKQQIADLQKELDTKLDGILNDDQKKQYKEMKENPGRGGPGGFGGRGGPPGGGPDRPQR